MASIKCPEGHRPLQMEDIAVGMRVVYVGVKDGASRPTVVECADVLDTPAGPSIRLKAKHVALISRIFVETDEVADGGAAAAIGAEVGSAAAAVGAEVGSAAAASVVGMDVDFSESDLEGANMFLKTGVATWIEGMEKIAQEKEITLPEVLKEKLLSVLTPDSGEPLASSFHDLVIYHMRQAVPWTRGYVNFMSVPNSSKKNRCHSCLNVVF